MIQADLSGGWLYFGITNEPPPMIESFGWRNRIYS